MSVALMLSKSILTYTLFRSTKAVAKASLDGVEKNLFSSRLCRCTRCGHMDENYLECDRCGSDQMHKMYRDYGEDNRDTKERRQK